MNSDPNRISIFEFDIKGKVIGTGSYSEIVLAKRHRDHKQYALKIVNKEKAMRANNVKYLLNERKVMLLLNHPRIIKLLWTAKDQASVYFFYELAPNGELWELLRGFPRFRPPIQVVKLWVAQVLSALEYLHIVHEIAHRDLKPENIVVDERWNLKLCDFGTSKITSVEALRQEYDNQIKTIAEVTKRIDEQEAFARQQQQQQQQQQNTDNTTTAPLKPVTVPSHDVLSHEEHRRRSILYQATRNNSFTGTPQYMAPEVIKNRPTRGTCSDMWSLGIMIYQLHTGSLPFNGDSAYLTFQSVLEHNIDWSNLDKPTGDLVRQLLQVDPTKRLGVAVDDGQIHNYDSVIQQHNQEQREQEKYQEELVRKKDEEGEQQYQQMQGGEEQLKPTTRLYTDADVQRFHELTVHTTREGFASIKKHPYFTDIPMIPLTTTPRPTSYTTVPDLEPLPDDIPESFFPQLVEAKKRSKDHIQYVDEHGNVIMTASERRKKELERQQREAEEMLEKEFESDFPKMKGNLVEEDEDEDGDDNTGESTPQTTSSFVEDKHQ